MKTISAVRAAGETHPGLQREVNEDRFHLDLGRGLYIVVDGVGGQAAGGKAADVAMQVLRARLERETGTVADRVREAWMSIVNSWLPGARVLDLFAGSGALGLEALSRGAESVDFVEIAPKSLSAIATNADRLSAAGQITLHRTDALRFLERVDPHAYDVAFADPPYGIGLA